jgi:hypothetical protein
MRNRALLLVALGAVLLLLAVGLGACTKGTSTPTPIDTPGQTEVPTETQIEAPGEMGAAAYAVDLIGAWVEAGVPKTDAFNYVGMDGNTHKATFAADILPLFTTDGVWFEGSQACSGCHFGAGENSYHEMNLTTYEGIRAGADVLEEPPGVSILGESEPGKGDLDWEHSKLRGRLRNNRMPPGWMFDLTEENRNGPCVTVGAQGVQVQIGQYGCELNAVGVIQAWVEAGAPNGEFEYGGAKLAFERDVLPFFTANGIWYEGSQACTGCHFGASENSYHEMDLSSYEGVRAGADSLEEPPGVSILGESEPGKGDFDWASSKLRERLRNNRMPPGIEFDITEENRNGPTILAGKRK